MCLVLCGYVVTDEIITNGILSCQRQFGVWTSRLRRICLRRRPAFSFPEIPNLVSNAIGCECYLLSATSFAIRV
jgi:hypothetical protein